MLALLPLPAAWLAGRLIRCAARHIVPALVMLALILAMPFAAVAPLPGWAMRITRIALDPAQAWALATVAITGVAAWLAASTSHKTDRSAANDNAPFTAPQNAL